MNEPKKDEVILTPSQDGSPAGNKDQAPVVEPTQKIPETEEQVTISKAEHDKLTNKANDFDGIIEKKRLEKLTKQPDDVIPIKPEALTGDEVIEAAKEAAKEVAAQAIQQSQAGLYSSNLQVAYKQFVDNNKWADDDEVITKISDKFKSEGALAVEDLLARLNMAAQNAFPKEYQQSLEDKATAKILADQSAIDVGDGGTAAGQHTQTVVEEQPTAYDIKQADKFFGGDVKKYMKYKPKN